MKIEREKKFFVDSFSSVRKRLREIGAKKGYAGPEKDWILDTNRSFLRRKRVTLRVRQSGRGSFLTYKGKSIVHDIKEAPEYEVGISDAPELRKIFAKLGYTTVFKYRKPRREYWYYDQASITLDHFPFGRFVEIEAKNKAEILRLAQKLALDLARSSTKSYRRLLEEYRKRRSRK